MQKDSRENKGENKMKMVTIIKDNKLVGTVKLQDSVFEGMSKDDGILLTKELNRGDSTILTFKLSYIDVVCLEGN